MDLFHDWRFVVFMGTLLFQIGMAWSASKGTRQDMDSLRGEIADLKRRVLNGISKTLQEHGQALAVIESRYHMRQEERERDERARRDRRVTY